MGHAVTVSLSNKTLEQVQRLAGLHQQALSQVVEDLLRHALANSVAAGNGQAGHADQAETLLRVRSPRFVASVS